MPQPEVISISGVLQARIQEIVDRYLGSGESTDIDKCNEAIASIYAAIDRQPPIIIWCDGPTQFGLAPVLAAILSRVDRTGMLGLQRFYEQERNNPVWKQLWKTFEDNVDIDRLMNIGKPGQPLDRKLDDTIKSILKQVDFWPNIIKSREIIRTLSVFTPLSQNLRMIFGTALSQRVDETRLYSQLTRLLNSMPIAGDVADAFEVGNYTRAVAMNRLFGLWMAAAIFGFSETAAQRQIVLQEFGILPLAFTRRRSPPNEAEVPLFCLLEALSCMRDKGLLPQCSDTINEWRTLLSNGAAYLFLENVCFACKLPSKATLDNENRLHNEDRAALQFSDGERFFVWHGTHIQDTVIQNKKQITASNIEQENNLETRRVMIEILGLEKYLREAGAELIHQDEYGRLYRKEYLRGEPLVVVEVVNATSEPDGTHRRYILRVPPDTRTAKEAVAWTFNMKSTEYSPDTET